MKKASSGSAAPSYAIGSRETIDAAWRRIVSEQYQNIMVELSGFADDPDSSAHNGRRRIKETRALLRLFRPHLGDRYDDANVLLRDTARRLASVRDADAMRQTLSRNRQRIVEKNGRLVHESARRALRRNERAHGAGAEVSAEEIAAMIGKLQLSLASLLTTPPLNDSFDALEDGIRRTYRDGRRAMTDALQIATAERFHEWRKHVKTLWYQTQLLRNVAPELTKPHRDLLNQLGKALGEHHDVHVLESFIATRRSRRREGVREVLSQRLTEIEQRSVALGQQLYAEKSSAFTLRMQRLWQTFRPESPATESAPQETVP